MIRNTFFATLGMLVLAASVQAGVVINSVKGTSAFAGHSLYTLTAVSDNAAQPILGFDFSGDPDNNDPATGLGFFGLMNQVNPVGSATVYQDANNFFPLVSRNVNEDSQFLFQTSAVVPSAPASQEGADILQATFAFADPQGLSVPFVQLVIPDAATGTVTYRGDVLVGQSGAGVNVRVSGSVGGDPPPVNLPPVIAGGGVIPVNLSTASPPTPTTASFQFQVTADDNLPTPGLTWSVQSFTGPGVLTGATVNGSGLLSWPADGSKGGIYTATVRATDNGGLFGEASVQFNLTVPEPATLSLFGLALVGFVGFARKRS